MIVDNPPLVVGDIAVFRGRLARWGEGHRRGFPWREETDPFRVLLGELLLQRSRSSSVAPVYRSLFDRWPTPAELAAAPLEDVEDTIRPLGFVSRAGRLRRIADVVARSGVPIDEADLVSLPGIGPYAARATRATAFDLHAPLVDGVSSRVYRRFFGLTVPSREPDSELWRLVERVSPGGSTRTWNWAVLDLASSICLPKRPLCGECPLEDRCAYAADVRAAAQNDQLT